MDTPEKDNELETAAKPVSKESKYVCKTKCYHKGVLYNIGDIYNAAAGEKLPEHFVKK